MDRIPRFSAELERAGLAGALVMHPISVYYLAGTGQPANLLVVPTPCTREPPVLGPGVETPLQEGMILTVEPKLISPSFGAVNIEDDLVVTADGCEILGDLPRALFVVADDGSVVTVP